MATFFLCMIYAAFISLGLPDSLLGAAWPAMQPALGVPLDSAGVLSMIVAGGTVVASLSADRMLHRFGTGRVTLVSVTMTACALLGYALAPGFWWLALAAVPMGLGAGAVDAGPDFLDAFDGELFRELVDKIIVESNDRLRFRLVNGLELTEPIERTVR